MNPQPHLFKTFTIHQQDSSTKTNARPLAESKYIFQESFSKTTKNTVKPTHRHSNQKEPFRQAENVEVVDEVADFKKYLHRSGIQNQAAKSKVHTRAKSKMDTQRQAMKQRLESKILQAQQKLKQIQFTLKKYQDEKSEIIKNSDLRRSSLHAWKNSY